MKVRTIKTETLKRRFKKLYTIVDFIQESCKAIILHSKLLESQGYTEEQKIAYMEMIASTKEWYDKVHILLSNIKTIEEMYYKNISIDGLECEVIETIPICNNGYGPNTFQMSEVLFRVGYYNIEGDPLKLAKREYTITEILKNIQELDANVSLCLKALINTTYQGIWEPIGLIVNKLFDYEPQNYICKFLVSYGIKE